jgi:alpha-tubulin suppressor-like RCC1 family protein
MVALEGEDVADVFVFNGCEHTTVATRDGKLYTCGYNYRYMYLPFLYLTHICLRKSLYI